jgi:hypothetical protein
MHDRRVAVELDEFCRGTTLRGNSELAEVWKLKDGVMAYMNYMHKIWPLEPGPQIIYKVLDDSRWATVAGDDKKLRANMIRQFFNEAVEENAGKAVVHAMCLTLRLRCRRRIYDNREYGSMNSATIFTN